MARYPQYIDYLPVKEAEREKKDLDIRRHRRNWRIARRASAAVLAVTVGTGLIVNHVRHDRQAAGIEQLDKERAKDRAVLALPYRDPRITRVTDTHQVADGRDAVQLGLNLPLSPEAAKLRQRYPNSHLVSWLDPAGVVVYRISNVDGKPSVGKPHFRERFQGRTPGEQLAEHGDTAAATVELPADVPIGTEVALFIGNTVTTNLYSDAIAMHEHNNVLSERQGEQYAGALEYEEHGGHHEWVAMASSPQLRSMVGDTSEQAPPGATL